MSQQALMKRIEREALKTAKQAKKTYKLALQSQNRKRVTHCQKCGAESDQLRQETDESNIAITYNSPCLCPVCYRNMLDSKRVTQ